MRGARSRFGNARRAALRNPQSSRPLRLCVRIIDQVSSLVRLGTKPGFILDYLKETLGASRSAGAEISNNWAGWKPNIPASTTFGKVSRAVLYSMTESLKA